MMNSGKFLGVAAIMGMMVATDAQAARDGGGGARVNAFQAGSFGGGGGAGMARASAPVYRSTTFRTGGTTFAQPGFVSGGRVITTSPMGFQSRGTYVQPTRVYYYRPGVARPVAFRRGAVITDRRLSRMHFADQNRFVVRGTDWRGDWRDRRHFRRAAFVNRVYAPSYYYPSSYYPSNYYSNYNYPPEYYTPTTTYYTTSTVPRYTYALAGSSTVLAVQKELAHLGYYKGSLDGIIGPQTRSAILRYQRDNGLPKVAAITEPLLLSLGVT